MDPNGRERTGAVHLSSDRSLCGWLGGERWTGEEGDGMELSGGQRTGRDVIGMERCTYLILARVVGWARRAQGNGGHWNGADWIASDRIGSGRTGLERSGMALSNCKRVGVLYGC